MAQITTAFTAAVMATVVPPKTAARPATSYTVRAAATDAATTQDLVNDIRQALINAGLIV